MSLTAKHFKIYDYVNKKHTDLTPTIILASKKDLSSWLGTIEAGCSVAAAVLENQVFQGYFSRFCTLKPLQSRITARNASHAVKVAGQNPSQQKEVGVGPDYLHCECLVESGLVELWISKISAQNPDVPKRGDGDGKEFTKADFAFNPVTLCIFSSAIEEASSRLHRPCSHPS